MVDYDDSYALAANLGDAVIQHLNAATVFVPKLAMEVSRPVDPHSR
jgi:hypothetical protein